MGKVIVCLVVLNKCPDAFPILSKAKGGVSQDGFDFRYVSEE